MQLKRFLVRRVDDSEVYLKIKKKIFKILNKLLPIRNVRIVISIKKNRSKDHIYTIHGIPSKW